MTEQRVPDLQKMDQQEAQHFLDELFSRLSAEAEYQIRHEDYTTEWPQSGERLRGREKMREFTEAQSQSRPPRRLRRVLVRDGLWVVEEVVDYGGRREVDVVLILELRDGKVFRETRYYAEPFAAPEWRAEWFERMKR
jgi:hypothetical protein